MTRNRKPPGKIFCRGVSYAEWESKARWFPSRISCCLRQLVATQVSSIRSTPGAGLRSLRDALGWFAIATTLLTGYGVVYSRIQRVSRKGCGPKNCTPPAECESLAMPVKRTVAKPSQNRRMCRPSLETGASPTIVVLPGDRNKVVVATNLGISAR